MSQNLVFELTPLDMFEYFIKDLIGQRRVDHQLPSNAVSYGALWGGSRWSSRDRAGIAHQRQLRVMAKRAPRLWASFAASMITEEFPSRSPAAGLICKRATCKT